MGIFSKNVNCRKGYKKFKDRCIKKNTPAQPGAMCLLDGKTFCSGDKSMKPMIARAGGKTQLVPTIMKKAPVHDVYVEPFVGGGAMFLRKPKAKKNVINDKDSDVITVYKSFQNGSGFSKCDLTPSKKRFDKIKAKTNKSACDVAYLNKLSFGSSMKSFALGKFMGKNPTGTYKKRFPVGRNDIGIKYQKAHGEDYKEKMKNTVVTSQGFEKVMKKYDSKKTLHYLDPPYVGTEKIYKENDAVSPEKVCDLAKKMKGKVIISYNDHPAVRKACKGMKISKVNTRYSFSGASNNKGAKEVLITNY